MSGNGLAKETGWEIKYALSGLVLDVYASIVMLLFGGKITDCVKVDGPACPEVAP